MAKKPLTKHQLDLVRYGTRDWPERLAQIGAQHPLASLAQKLYGQKSKLIPDDRRGYVSKLGGQAVQAQQTKGRR